MILLEIQDEKSRVILKQSDKDKAILGRYKDLNEQIKAMAIAIFCDITNSDIERVTKFMNFESDENSFCS